MVGMARIFLPNSRGSSVLFSIPTIRNLLSIPNTIKPPLGEFAKEQQSSVKVVESGISPP
jgi:hypothetical protein